MTGWKNYFKLTTVKAEFHDLDTSPADSTGGDKDQSTPEPDIQAWSLRDLKFMGLQA